jgi:hypothetical protein
MESLQHGRKVFVVSNNVSPWKGEFNRWEFFNNNKIPIITSEEGINMMVFGVIFPMDPGLFHAFASMGTEKAWKVACDVSMIIRGQ